MQNMLRGLRRSQRLWFWNKLKLLRYGRFSEKGSKELKNSNFLTFFFEQESETYFSSSTTPNTSFYKVLLLGNFMK